MSNLFNIFRQQLENSINIDTSYVRVSTNTADKEGSSMMESDNEGHQVPHPKDNLKNTVYRKLARNLDSIAVHLGRYLNLILNDPDLYSQTISEFFDDHKYFQMIPMV
jgi:RIO-like serine/threonine protein kinase